jgi:Photosynthetic reaction centre cytochrome C subunit
MLDAKFLSAPLKSIIFVAIFAASMLLAQAGSSSGQNQSTPAGAATTGAPQTSAPPAGAPAQGRHPMIPDTFTNLKVLPKDIKKPELLNMMKGFSMQLGRRCSFCHDANDDLSQADFASDKKIEKETARVMIKMMAEINQEFLAKLPEMPAEATCWTCHRGKNKPEKFVPPQMPAGGPPRSPNGANGPPDAQHPDVHSDAQRKDASPNTQSNAPPK